jgi:hypothetical protein
LPLWNPLVGNGAPLLANYQSALFYPLNWLSLVLPLPYSFGWLIVIHLILAGAGMVTLTRSLGLKPFGQVIAGLAFGMSQYLVSRAGFLSMNAALAWLPWIVWAADRFLLTKDRSNHKYALLLVLFAALQLLAGHAQITWYTDLLLGGWVIYRALTNRIRFWRLAPLVACLVLAAGLASIQLVPTAEFLLHSQRASEYGYENAAYYSYWPARLVTLLVPDFFGNPAHSAYFGFGTYWEDADYIGVLPLVLVLGFFLSRLKFKSRNPALPSEPVKHTIPNSMLLFLGATLLISLLFALGKNTPIFPFLYRHIPTFSLFQAPTRFMLWFEFCLALIAGIAADEWRPLSGNWSLARRGMLSALAILVIISIVAVFYFLYPGSHLTFEHFKNMLMALLPAVFLLAIFAILDFTQPALDSPGRFRWMCLVAGVLAIDLIYVNRGLTPEAPNAIYTPQIQARTAGGHRVLELDINYSHFFNFQAFGLPEIPVEARTIHLKNTNMLDGVASEDDYDPLLEERYSKLLSAIHENQSAAVLQLADVATLLQGGPDGKISLVPAVKAPARVWIVFSSTTVPDSTAALAVLFAPDFDPAQTVILENGDAGVLASHSIPADTPPVLLHSPDAQIVNASADSVKVAVSLPRAGTLVLSDTFYPGWFVYVDGRPARLFHADYAFRGVAVPAGRHLVEFRYEPFSFRLGASLSGLSGMVFAGLLAWFIRLGTRRRSQPANTREE